MFNSIDTSSGEINTVGCDTSFPKFIDYHNQLPYVSNSPHCNNVKTPFLRSRLPDYTRDHTVNFEKQGLNQLPAEVMERKTILISLNLSNNKFEYFPLEILQIKTLRTLRLDYNKIKSVPSDIFQLANLESLSLSYNALQFLPASISKLGRLKELNLEHNILDNLPQEIGEFQCLKILNILNNRLDNIPTSFGSLVSIQEFSIEWFRYTEPKLSVHQRGYCSEHNINKLRDKCNELQRNGVKTLFFEGFLELFSFSKRNFLATDDLGRTLLHFACLNQDISVIKYLISHTPEIIDIADKNNLTALCLSLLEDKQKSVHCLLKYGANVSQGGGSFGSPLHIATKRLNYNAVQKILQRGEDTNKTDIKGNTPLHYAVDLMTEKYDEARRIAQQLLDYKADPNIKNKENWTPLHCIAKKRDARALSWALSYNLEVEEIDGGEEIFKLDKSGGNFNWTAMHIAVYVGAFELVVKLGEADADMFKKSVNGYTPKAVSSKHGLALKFAEKYEQKWIKKHLLHKKASHSESLAYQNLLRFNNKKEISNASKNKFEGACLMIPYAPQESSFTLNNITKTRVRMLSPLLGTGLMTRRQEEESFDFTPESPTSISAEEEEVPSEDCDFIDFNSELNEGNNGEGNTYAKEVPMSHKKENNIKQPAAINSTNEASGSYFKKDQGKEKGSGFAQQAFEFDNDTYETRLKEMTNFDITFCKTELRFLKDHLMLTKLSFTEKMKIFISFKILHKVIVEYICTKFGDRISPGLLPYITLTNRQNASINSFYELVPQCLINCFMSLETQNYETAMNKLQLVKMLTEMKYYPAIDFFQNVVNNPLEAFWVKQEARNGYNSLTLSLGLDARKSRK